MTRFARSRMLAHFLCGALLAASPAQAAPGTGPGDTIPPPIPWSSSAVPDSGKDFGKYASAAYASSLCLKGGALAWCSVIGIAHLNKTNSHLMYSSSTDEGQTFTTVTVDADAGGDLVGFHASLVFHGTKPMISYQDATSGTLKFATRVATGAGNCGPSSSWSCKTVESGGNYSSIGVSSNGQVRIAHAKSGGVIRLTKADAPYTTFSGQDVTNANPRSLRLALDAVDQTHLAWAKGECIFYTYAFFEEIETVACSPANPTSDAGRVSLVTNNSLRPHLAYVLNTSSGGHVVRRSWKIDYQTWSHAQVALVSKPLPGTSLALDTDEAQTVAVSYGYTGSDGVDHLVVSTPGGLALGGWTAVGADSPGGSFSSMIRIGGDKLAIAHYDDAAGNLRFTKHD